MTERSRKMISELNPRAQPVFTDFFTGLDNFIGENQYIVFEGRWTVRVQEVYYAQGKKPLAEVNALRKLTGLYLLWSEKDNYEIT
jgi:hypothetical protein